MTWYEWIGLKRRQRLKEGKIKNDEKRTENGKVQIYVGKKERLKKYMRWRRYEECKMRYGV